MARKSPQELQAEQAQEKPAASAKLNDDVDRVDGKIPLVNQTPRLPNRSKPSTLTAEEERASRPKRWRVKRDLRIVVGTGLTTLRADKIIDERSYNIAQLRAQGAELELVRE